jgi:adenylyltransferase/sulfurtransferase
VRDLAARIKEGEPVVLVDVRQPVEHEISALPGSVLIPLDQLSARFQDVQPPAGSLVVVYCHHGIRSLAGAGFLEQRGLSNVVSLSGGIDAWSVHIDPTVPRY